MYIIAGLVTDKSILNYISEARVISFKIFNLPQNESRMDLLNEYDKTTDKIEELLKNLNTKTICDEETYELISKAGAFKGIEDGELLAGYFDRDRTEELLSVLGQLLGKKNHYYQNINNLVKGMGEGEFLVFWNVGEEKKNEIFSA